MHWANCRQRSICWDKREGRVGFPNKNFRKPCRIEVSGRGAAWLARLLGVQEVPSSNLGGPTKFFRELQTPDLLLFCNRGPNKVQMLKIWTSVAVVFVLLTSTPSIFLSSRDLVFVVAISARVATFRSKDEKETTFPFPYIERPQKLPRVTVRYAETKQVMARKQWKKTPRTRQNSRGAVKDSFL
jgi:hypothetical protein